MTRQEAVDAILKELDRAVAKSPTWPTDAIHASAVVNKEAGELVKACLEATYEYPKAQWQDAEKGAVQTGAMTIRFLMSMEKYDFEPQAQHKQDT